MSSIFAVKTALQTCNLDPYMQMWVTLTHIVHVIRQRDPSSNIMPMQIDFLAQNGIDNVCVALRDTLPNKSLLIGGDLPSLSNLVLGAKPVECSIVGKCNASECKFKKPYEEREEG